MIKLGVNIDHVATVRQARLTVEPDPVAAAALCEFAGAHGITVHLREDRRHIQDRDVEMLRKKIRTRLNLEMAVAGEIISFAERVRPDSVCLVPEKRDEVTTEGGLDAAGNSGKITGAAKRLKAAGITVSIFIDPVEDQISAAAGTGTDFIELHTGCYASAQGATERQAELDKLISMGEFASGKGLRINAGHGLTYGNVRPVLVIPHLEELNIGHSIISRAIFVGLEEAVREMLDLLKLGPTQL